MGKSPRINVAGFTYHAWANATNGQRLFRDDIDKDVFVALLRELVRRNSWICLAWVVMSTHYHLLLRLKEPTLSSGFQRLNLRYALYYNRRYNLRGHAFTAPYSYKIVDGSFHELETARYLANNPVQAAMCKRPEEYPWSSYASLIGLHRPDEIVDEKAALAPLGGSRQKYRLYVETKDLGERWDQVIVRSARAARQPQRAQGGRRR